LRAEKSKLERDKTAMETKLQESLLKARSETEESRTEKNKLEKEKTAVKIKFEKSLSKARSEIEK
jgi:hypothetical protein